MTQQFSFQLVGEPPVGVNFHSHGSTLYFDLKSWEELSRMMRDFSRTGAHVTGNLGARRMQNYADLPTRTPLHANYVEPPRKTKPTLEDLV